MIPHVLLANNELVIQLPTGPITRTNRQFNYTQILHTVQHGTIDDLTPLLAPVACPTGVYHLYLGPTLLVGHVANGSNTNYILNNGYWATSNFNTGSFKYLGPFTSFEAIQEAYPEYFL